MPLMSKPLRVLLVEDSQADAFLISAELRRHGYDLDCACVQTGPAFCAQLEGGSWDVIIADYRLPRFSALDALRLVRERQPDLPFLIVSGTIGEEDAVAAMKAGAHDYVMKDKLARLVPAVERELREAAVRRARAAAEKRARFQAQLLNAVGQAVVATDATGSITYWNQPAERLCGWLSGEALGRNLADLLGPTGKTGPPFKDVLARKQSWLGEVLLARHDGSSLTALVASAPVTDSGGQFSGMILVFTDVTERKRAELELQTSREQLRALAVKLESTREEERKRLSRDIHDELGQVLTGLKMELAWMRSRLSDRRAGPREALLDKIAFLGQQIDTSANAIRKLCAELRPGILDDLGLVAAIDWQARQFSTRTGIQCRLDDHSNGQALDPEASTAIFRIFQEVLTNVTRHARAQSVRVSLTQTGSAFILEAQDDGQGIRPQDLSGANSLGLLGMRERALALGGRIEFLTRQPRGTTVRLEVPIKRPKAPRVSPSRARPKKASKGP